MNRADSAHGDDKGTRLAQTTLANNVMDPLHDASIRSTGFLVVTSIMAIVAAILAWAVVWTDVQSPGAPTNWTVFGLITALLIGCSRAPSTWIKFGDFGVITPLWMFSYALLLLGTPSAGVAVGVLGATIQAVSHVESVASVINRVAATTLSLATAALLLTALGVRGAVTQFDVIPADWAFTMLLAGAVILLLNTATTAVTMAVRRGISLLSLLKRGLAVRVSAEGAMLSLAPIWVIALDFSPMLLPLLMVTTLLVFRSTRQALERSHEAHHDALTGMHNRRAFLDALSESLLERRAEIRTTVLVMDLNGFKEVNDRLGHQIGDALLIAFADRLRRSLPSDAVAARLGGDEFAVLISSSAPRSTIRAAVEGLSDKLVHPLTVEGFPVSIGVSIGFASAPEDGTTPRDLVRAADVAMYKAKRTGTTVESYENCVRGPQRGRLNLLGDLSEAISREQLTLQFQPQLRLHDGSVEAIEALVRWDHPEHGRIPPSEFVGLAEQTDLITPVTILVLRMATESLQLAQAPKVRLAVNVSTRSLQDPDFAPGVLKNLARVGFAASRLEFEITERAIVTNAERITYSLEMLRRAGVRIAIDDFGVGYSSFQTLRMLDVDRVKIDRDFVQGVLSTPRDRIIVKSLIDMAHELGLDVVAEGIESVPVWDALRELGCDVGQGFGIAVPMGISELRDWMARWGGITPGAPASLPRRISRGLSRTG